MANTIRIKRRPSSGSAGAPSSASLYNGELAFNENDNILYYAYGSGTGGVSQSVPAIGGSGAYSLRGGTNATGTWPIGITGNAGTVTSGVYSSRTITPGSGLAGSAALDLSADRTFNIGQGDGITVSADSIAVDSTVIRTTGVQRMAGFKSFDGNAEFGTGNQTGFRLGDQLGPGASGAGLFDGLATPIAAEYWLGSDSIIHYAYGGGTLASPRIAVREDSGNVGIGISTPSAKLHVNGSGIFASGLNIANQTASTLASFDANKNVTSLSTATYPSLTELAYVKGVTSAIQTQIDGKVSTSDSTVVRTTGNQTVNGRKTFGDRINISHTGSFSNIPSLNIGGGGDNYFDYYTGQQGVSSGYFLAGLHGDASSAPFRITFDLVGGAAITNGEWRASTIAVDKGGTGATTLTANNILVGNGTSAISAPYSVETTLTGGSSALPRADAVKTYVDNAIVSGISINDAMIFKGTIDCSANPNYPAADRGWVYKISVAGRIGGASGPVVEVNDTIICGTDSTAAGTHASVGSNWNILQTNIVDSSILVTGPASATSGNFAMFDGTTGKIVKDSSLNSSSFATASHTHGNISNVGAIGSNANLPIITTTAGTLTTGSFGTTANTFCQGNDSRIGLTTNTLTVNNGGAGTASSFTFNGNTAQTISYNSIGAPSISGTNATGTWGISINGNAATVTSGVYTSRTLTAGSGLVGGGDLSSDKTFDIGQGDGISVTADTIAVDSTVVRTTGNQTLGGTLTVNGSTLTVNGVTLDATELGRIDGLTAGTVSASKVVTVDANRDVSNFRNVSIGGNLTITGTGLVSSNINDFNTSVRTNRLDQMAVPTASVSMNSQALTNVLDPTNPQDAATKAYVDAARSGLDVKQSVRVATTANITLSGTQTIDGVVLSAGDRVLVKDQSTGSQNGIYVVAAGAWSRATDADLDTEVTAGMFTFVAEGTTNADSGWVLTTNDSITLGTTALAFAQFSGAGQITAGSGLTKSGNTIGLATAYGDTVNPYGSKTANTVLAAPNGSSGAPSFRALVSSDIPSLGSITNAGAIGSTANLPIITTTAGALTTGSFGSTANTFCQGNDSRLSDTRNTTNSITINNGGAGDSSSFTFNGSAARTISYNSIGSPSISGTNATGTWNISISGNAATVTSGVIGVGTSGYLSKWTSSSAISSGIIYDDGSKIGIRTNSPNTELHVIGTGLFSSSLNAGGSPAGTQPSLYARGANTNNNSSCFRAEDSNYAPMLDIRNDGNILIGQFSGATHKLAIKGSTSDSSAATLLLANSSGNTILFARNDGNVGIGTSSPTSQLHVIGSGIFSSGLNIPNQTASTIASFDANKNVTSLSTATYPSLTELAYVKGVTSAIQTQIDGKAATNQNMYIGTTLFTINRSSASQTLTGISIDGNAGTVTSGVYTSGSYADPAWISSLAKSKVGLSNVTDNAQVKKLASSTNGNIPIWNGTTGDALSDGYSIETTLTGGSSSLPRADAVKTYVDNAVTNGFSLNDAMVFKGTIGAGGTPGTLPTGTISAGWTYRVVATGTYAGVVCEIGDLIIGVADAAGNVNSTWTVAQTNIDGAVVGPASSTDNHLALFNGATGKIIKDAGFSATTVGQNLISLTNPGTISFTRINADNSVSSLSDTDFRTAIGAAASGQTMFIGTTSVAINRSSSSLVLTGITSIDGNAATVTNGVYTTGAQTIAGVKTLSDRPVLNSGLSVQASAAGSAGTYFPVFTADPGSSAQVLTTRTASNLKTDLSLNNVENTALSTWAGSTNITTLGTIGTGTWSATTIAANKGGTGQSSYAVGDLLYADTSSTLAKLADVATGNALLAGGVGVAPSWGKIGLTTHVTGTLPVANGGTGDTTYTNGQLLIGNSTGNTLTKATLTQGTAIDITNSTGSITIGHNDTSTLSGAQGSNGIASFTVDGMGHVTAVTTATYLTAATVCASIVDCSLDGGTF